MNLLLLEDDATLAANLSEELCAAGYNVEHCTSCEAAAEMAIAGTYTVLVFDRMVENIDSLASLSALRRAGIGTPALLLTAMNGVDDRVEGLEAGADDYLEKPFSMRELLARLNVLVRRASPQWTATRLKSGHIEIDRLKRTCSCAGSPVSLQFQEFKLLEYLLLNKGQLVTRSMLLQDVWSCHFETRTNVIESHMSRLRAKLCEGGLPDLIQTWRGNGYVLQDA